MLKVCVYNQLNRENSTNHVFSDRNWRCSHLLRRAFHDARHCALLRRRPACSRQCEGQRSLDGTDTNVLNTAPLPVWHHSNYWPNENILLLRAQAKDSCAPLFPGRYLACIPQMAVHWGCCGSIRVLESIWVRLRSNSYAFTNLSSAATATSSLLS